MWERTARRRPGTADRLMHDDQQLQDALNTVVRGFRLGDLGTLSLRTVKLWIRNRLTAAPDDPALLRLAGQIDLVSQYRRFVPLPRPAFVPGFDPTTPEET